MSPYWFFNGKGFLLVFSLFVCIFKSDSKFLTNIFSNQVLIDHVESCSDVKQLDIIIPSVKKYNRTVQILNFDMSFKDGFDDSQNLFLEIKKWSGGWKNNFFKFEGRKACSNAFKLLGDVMKSIVTAAGGESKCPIPKGNYTAKDIVIDFSKVPLVTMDGRYKVRIKTMKNKKDAGICIDAIVEVKKNA